MSAFHISLLVGITFIVVALVVVELHEIANYNEG